MGDLCQWEGLKLHRVPIAGGDYPSCRQIFFLNNKNKKDTVSTFLSLNNPGVTSYKQGSNTRTQHLCIALTMHQKLLQAFPYIISINSQNHSRQ